MRGDVRSWLEGHLVFEVGMLRVLIALRNVCSFLEGTVKSGYNEIYQGCLKIRWRFTPYNKSLAIT